MKTKMGLFGLALTLCVLYVGRTQEPTAEDILKRVAATYQGITSYQDTATMKMQMKMMGMDITFDMSGSLATAKPNKMNMTFKMTLPAMVNPTGGSMEMNVVSDGKKMWAYMSAGKQYMEKDAPKSLAAASEVLGGGGAGGMMGGSSPSAIGYGIILSDDVQKTLMEQAKNPKLAGSEDVGGKSAYVLTWETGLPDVDKAQAPVPLPPNLKDLKLPVKAWVSKDDGLILQMTMDMSPMFQAMFSMFAEMGAQGGANKEQQEQMKAMLKDMQMVLIETHKDIKINQPIPDETFVFKPPADAKKVEQLDMSAMMQGMPGMPGMRGGGEEAPSPLLGKPAPDFTLKDRTGKPIKLSQLRGKPVLLNFWAEF